MQLDDPEKVLRTHRLRRHGRVERCDGWLKKPWDLIPQKARAVVAKGTLGQKWAGRTPCCWTLGSLEWYTYRKKRRHMCTFVLQNGTLWDIGLVLDTFNMSIDTSTRCSLITHKASRWQANGRGQISTRFGGVAIFLLFVAIWSDPITSRLVIGWETKHCDFLNQLIKWLLIQFSDWSHYQ